MSGNYGSGSQCSILIIARLSSGGDRTKRGTVVPTVAHKVTILQSALQEGLHVHVSKIMIAVAVGAFTSSRSQTEYYDRSKA